MILSAFRALVREHFSIDADPYVAGTDTAGLNALIDERLRALARETYFLYRQRVAVASWSGASVDLGDQRVVEVVKVYVAGVALRDYAGRIGFVNLEDLSFADLAAGTPTRVAKAAPWHLHFDKASVAMTTLKIDAYVEPDAIVDDNAEVPLPPGLERYAAAFVASAAVMPRESGAIRAKRVALEGEAREAFLGVAKAARAAHGVYPPVLAYAEKAARAREIDT